MASEIQSTDYGPMAGYFECARLGSLCVEDAGVQTGPFGSQLHQEDYVTAGTPIITVEHLGDNRITHTNLPRVSEDDRLRLSRYSLQDGDIVFSRVGSVDRRALVRREEDGWLFSGRCLRVRVNKERIYPQFLSLFFGLEGFKEHIRRVAVGATMPSINTKILSDIPIYFPPLAEQRAITAVLGALDDKIELNRRMNATLEAMARALFQSWFVDFDPVRAKLDGREPFGLDPDTAALFPDTFQDSELGRFPNGWTLGRVVDASDFSRSSISPGGFPDETFDHYSLPAFDEGRTPKAEFGGAIMSNKFVVSRDSVLLSKLNPHIPRIWLPDLHATRRSVCSTEFIVASTRPGYSREFLFSLFTSGVFASTYGTLVTGTTGSHQRIRPESVLDMKIVIPPPPLVDAFAVLAKPMFDQINRNIDQSRTLAILRDTLLPKLLRGDLIIESKE